MSENDPYGSEGGALNDRPYPYCRLKHFVLCVTRIMKGQILLVKKGTAMVYHQSIGIVL